MKIAKLIYVLLALAIIGLLCYQGFVTHELTTGDLTKGILVLVGIVLGWMKLGRKRSVGNKKAVYSKAYAKFIGTAFDGEKKLEKKLYSAIDDFNTEKYTSGIKKLEKLLSQCEQSAQCYTVYVFMGLCYDNLHAYPQAIDAYKKALQLREDSTVASNLGTCCDAIGDYDSAAEFYLRAVRCDSTNPYPLNNLAQLYIKKGEYETALPYAQQALALKQNMVPALNAMTTCHTMLGNEEEAEQFFRRAVAAGSNAKALRAYIDSLQA